jgi:hypothetical protein
MAVAKRVSDVEPSNLDWLEIEDEEGANYRYFKGKRLTSFTVRHVRRERGRGDKGMWAPVLETDTRTGQVVLRQAEPGLPKKIVVDLAFPPEQQAGPPLGVVASWSGPPDAYEYELKGT